MSDDVYDPPMFDLPRQTRTPPGSVGEDGAGRPLTACEHIGTRDAWTDEVDRRERTAPPKCNRTAGHDGPHRQISRRNFGILAEWAA